VRILDRYVFFAFLKAFLISLLLFSIVSVIFDYFGRMNYLRDADRVQGTFAEDYSDLGIVARFYLAYLPYLLKQVFPFVSVAAAAMVVGALLRNNEVMPVMAAGVSVRRLLLPLFVAGALVSLVHFGFNEYLLPSLNRKHVALKRMFSGDRTPELLKLAHLRDGRGTVTRAQTYSFADQSLKQVVIHRPWKETGFDRWTTSRLVPDGEGWAAPEGALIMPAGLRAQPRRVPPGTHIDIGVSPGDVEALASKQGTAEISFAQLKRLVRKFPGRRNLRVSLHKQVARPLTSLVLLLVVVPMVLALGTRRFTATLLTILLCAIYFFLDIFFSSIGDRGDLSPIMAAYFPLALLFSFGMARLLTLRS
jgi:lipopolysaccharide export system permease protein